MFYKKVLSSIAVISCLTTSLVSSINVNAADSVLVKEQANSLEYYISIVCEGHEEYHNSIIEDGVYATANYDRYGGLIITPTVGQITTEFGMIQLLADSEYSTYLDYVFSFDKDAFVIDDNTVYSPKLTTYYVKKSAFSSGDCFKGVYVYAGITSENGTADAFYDMHFTGNTSLASRNYPVFPKSSTSYSNNYKFKMPQTLLDLEHSPYAEGYNVGIMYNVDAVSSIEIITPEGSNSPVYRSIKDIANDEYFGIACSSCKIKFIDFVKQFGDNNIKQFEGYRLRYIDSTLFSYRLTLSDKEDLYVYNPATVDKKDAVWVTNNKNYTYPIAKEYAETTTTTKETTTTTTKATTATTTTTKTTTKETTKATTATTKSTTKTTTKSTTKTTTATTKITTTTTIPTETTTTTAYEKQGALSVIGDANCDGHRDIVDVITINKAVLGKETINPEYIKYIDSNMNNKPDSTDSLQLMKLIVGLISEVKFFM